MTLIATLVGEGLPILMGDIIISSGIPNDGQINVPTAGNVSNSGLYRSLTGLRQKLTVVTSNLAVGWAGSRIAAETVIKELMDSSKRKDITRTSLVDFMNSIDDLRKSQLELVGLLLENDAIVAFRSANCESFTSNFGEIRAAGSGVEDLKKFIGGFEPPIYTESFNPWVKSIAIFMGVSTYMLGRELLSLDALTQRFYGGGFELVFFEGGSFKKSDDISYLFWEASEDESGWHISLPSALAKYSYHNDILLIRTIKLQGGDSESPSVKPISNSIHVVPPVYRRVTDDEISELPKLRLPSFNSRVICNFVMITPLSGQSSVLYRMMYGTDASAAVQFEEEGNKLIGISFDGQFLHSLSSSIVESPSNFNVWGGNETHRSANDTCS